VILEEPQSSKERRSIHAKEYYKNNRLRIKKRVLNKKYEGWGTSLAEKKILYKSQEGRCAICHKKLTLMSAHLDHDHKTNKVRGILCSNCNTAIGLLNDSVDRTVSAAFYLKRNEK